MRSPRTQRVGRLDREHLWENSYDGNLGATLTRRFGDLDARLSLRGTFELSQREHFGTRVTNLIAHATRSLDSGRDILVYDGDVPGGTSPSIGLRDERANGAFANLALNFRDKWTGEFRVRRDGSSLFGEDARWHTYFAGAAAYRLSQEPWFNLDAVDEIKLHLSRGTAGGRPSFAAQYETYSVSAGSITPVNLGNRNLKPEQATEQDPSLTMVSTTEIGFHYLAPNCRRAPSHRSSTKSIWICFRS
jgi:outer membrane cobalamin receptor